MAGCFWIGKDEGSFRWNMEWVVGKREGRSVGELCPVEGEREMGGEWKVGRGGGEEGKGMRGSRSGKGRIAMSE